MPDDHERRISVLETRYAESERYIQAVIREQGTALGGRMDLIGARVDQVLDEQKKTQSQLGELGKRIAKDHATQTGIKAKLALLWVVATAAISAIVAKFTGG